MLDLVPFMNVRNRNNFAVINIFSVIKKLSSSVSLPPSIAPPAAPEALRLLLLRPVRLRGRGRRGAHVRGGPGHPRDQQVRAQRGRRLVAGRARGACRQLPLPRRRGVRRVRGAAHEPVGRDAALLRPARVHAPRRARGRGGGGGGGERERGGGREGAVRDGDESHAAPAVRGAVRR